MALTSPGTFNIAKGRAAELQHRVDANDPSTSVLVIVLLAYTGLVADATMKDYATLAAVLAGASDEATNTGYARKILTDTDIGDFSVDNTNDWVLADVPDQVWSSVANDGTGRIGGLLVCYDPVAGSGTDSEIIPLTYQPFDVTPNGGSITATIDSLGYFKAA